MSLSSGDLEPVGGDAHGPPLENTKAATGRELGTMRLGFVRLFAASVALLLLTSCGLVDSGRPWRSGPYALHWIDNPDEVELAYDRGNGGWVTLVGPRVFAVGANGSHVVAKQHPRGDRAITHFYIIETSAGAEADSRRGIIGPLDEQAFLQQSAALGLPPFTKTLESLR